MNSWLCQQTPFVPFLANPTLHMKIDLDLLIPKFLMSRFLLGPFIQPFSTFNCSTPKMYVRKTFTHMSLLRR